MLDTEAPPPTAATERTRIVTALIEVAAERGYLETTIDSVLERAGLQRDAFDRHFRGKNDCFLAAWQEINEQCMAAMLAAFNSQGEWPDRLRSLTCEVIGALSSHPQRAAFAIEVLAVGDPARARRDMTMRVIASLIDAGRKEMNDPDSVPHTTAEALAGSAYGQIFAKVVAGKIEELPELIPQLMAAMVMPYLGLDAALVELRRGVAAPAHLPAPLVPGFLEAVTVSRAPSEVAAAEAGPRRGAGAGVERRRLIAGFAAVVAEHGYAASTVAQIARHAALPEAAFYAHFEDREECFLAAYELFMAELRRCLDEAIESDEDWARALRRGIAAILAFLAAEPDLAQLCLVEAMVSGPIVVEHFDAAVQSLAPYLRRGREGRNAAVLKWLSPATEEALAGGMLSLLSRRLLGEAELDPAQFCPDLVEFLLTPYLGAADAAAVARE